MEKINIAKLLKDCPKGMELDCTLYEDVTLFCASDSGVYPIKIETPDGLVSLDKYGGYSSNEHAKCLIFPKGKTTWEGFVPPHKFKVGDRVKHKSAFIAGIIVKVTDKGYHIDYPTGEGVCYVNFTLEKDYELVPNRFDITTLKPFDKVLVRDNDEQMWTTDIFSFYNEKHVYPFMCVGHYTNQCIPYEGNEHLLGKTDDCDEFYKTWE